MHTCVCVAGSEGGGGKHLNLCMQLGGKRGEGMGGVCLVCCVMCVCVCVCVEFDQSSVIHIACITVNSSVLLLNVDDRTLVKSSSIILI